MCSHHLVEPVACTPASGWEKGQVENQVGLVRERFFTPRLQFKSYDELNAWLFDKCLSWTKAHAHPERPDQTIWEVFEAERPEAHSVSRPFRWLPRVAGLGVEDLSGAVRQQQILVSASAVGRPVDIHAYADRIVIRQDGRAVAEHRRCYGRGETMLYDPWHYVPVLARKPGALRNGRRSRTGCCRRRSIASGASSPVPTTATGRWSKSSPRCSPTDWPRSRRLAFRHSPRASIPPTSSSTFWRASAIRAHWS